MGSGWDYIAQWLASMPSDPAAISSIPRTPKFIPDEIIDAAEVYEQQIMLENPSCTDK